jgi:hypothetical protein
LILVFGFTLLSLVLCALHFLGFASERHSLAVETIRDESGFATWWRLKKLGISADRAREHGHIEEDGWRRRSLLVGSRSVVQEIGEGRWHVTAAGNLWVASSDNTRIAENGRDYVLVVPRKLPPILLFSLPIGFALLWWRAKHLRPLVLACAGSLAVVTVMMAQTEAAWELRQRNEKLAEIDGDLWGYHTPVLHFVEHGEVSQHSHRAFGYPLFVGLILRHGVTSFEYLTHVQQLISLASAWLLAAAVVLALRHIFRLPWWVAGVGACLAHWLYVFSPSAIHLEAAYRPEIMVMSGASAYLLLAVCAFAVWRRVRHLSPTLIVLLVAMSVTAVLIFFLKQAWGLAMFSPLLFAVAIADIWRRRGVCLLITAAAWMMSYFPLALYQSHLEERFDREQSQLFTPRYLLFWQADIIRPVLARRAAANPEEPFLAGLHQVFEEEFTREHPTDEFALFYRKFDFVPEDIRREIIPYTDLWEPEKKADLYVGMFLEGVLTQPVRYAVKVARQLGWYYSFSGVPYPTLSAKPEMRFHGGWQMLGPRAENTVRILDNGAEIQRLERAEHLFFEPAPRRVKTALELLGRAVPWMLILTLPFALFQCLRRVRGRALHSRDGDGLTLRAMLAFVALPFLVLLTFAMLTTLSIDRFISMALPLTLFSQVCLLAYAAVVVAGFVRRRWRSGRHRT